MRYIPPAETVTRPSRESTVPAPIKKDERKIPPRHREVSQENRKNRTHIRVLAEGLTLREWQKTYVRLRQSNPVKRIPIACHPFNQVHW